MRWVLSLCILSNAYREGIAHGERVHLIVEALMGFYLSPVNNCPSAIIENHVSKGSCSSDAEKVSTAFCVNGVIDVK